MPLPAFKPVYLEQISKILGDTHYGLTGSQIGQILMQLGIPDTDSTATKWKRLFAALSLKQAHGRYGNAVIAFILETMNPVRYTGEPVLFDWRRNELNKVLSFCGYTLGEDGKIRRTQTAKTLTEAEHRADRLKTELKRRNVHPDVLHFCRAELLQENFFHAVFEATKSIADKIRQKTELLSDGVQLVDRAFGLKDPLLAINSLESETDKSEHRGFANLLKGTFGTFRNVTAHVPKIKWPINEQNALDLLSLVSYLHRRLDNAYHLHSL